MASATNNATEKSPLLPQVTISSVNLSSEGKTLGNILISIVGAGVLGLPYSFMKTGWLSGIIVIAAVAFIAFYGMMLLVWSKRALHRQGFQKIETFGDLGFAVYGRKGKAFVDFMVVLCIAGVCVGYMIFMGNTLCSVFSGFKLGNYLSLSSIVGRKAKFIWALLPLELVMNGDNQNRMDMNAINTESCELSLNTVRSPVLVSQSGERESFINFNDLLSRMVCL